MPIYGNCFDFTPFVYKRWTFRIAPRIPRSVMSASKATQPARQLGSTKIKNAALCYLSPIVVGKCSIIHAIAYADLSEGLEHAWRNVCRTRDICDNAISGKLKYYIS